MKQFPPIRTQDEIQKAHDFLSMIALGEVPNPFNKNDPFAGERMIGLTAALDVLCWILHHDHNPHFGANLKFIEEAFKNAGIVIGRYSTPQRRRKN